MKVFRSSFGNFVMLLTFSLPW